MDRSPSNELSLIAFASGELSADDARAVEAELARDPAAKARVELLRQAITSLRTDDGEAPAAEAVARVQTAVRAMLGPARQVESAGVRWWEGLLEVAATLFFDSRSAPALASGLRGISATRELSYCGDGVEIDLGIEPQTAHEQSSGHGGLQTREGEPRARLVGQISVHAGAIDRIAVTRGTPRRLVAELVPDARGVFVQTLERGRYDLLIAQGDRVLTIEGLEVE